MKNELQNERVAPASVPYYFFYLIFQNICLQNLRGINPNQPFVIKIKSGPNRLNSASLKVIFISDFFKLTGGFFRFDQLWHGLFFQKLIKERYIYKAKLSQCNIKV